MPYEGNRAACCSRPRRRSRRSACTLKLRVSACRIDRVALQDYWKSSPTERPVWMRPIASARRGAIERIVTETEAALAEMPDTIKL